MSRVEEILKLVDAIPPFPKVAQQVMAMVGDPMVTAKALADVVRYDQAITANVLKICNAAYFGLARKVSSLDDALVIIGHDALKEVIMASSSARFYKGAAGTGYHLEQGEMWRHAVATAITAKLLVHRFPGVDQGTAFTAGLLHDIGKRFLSTFVAEDFKRIMLLVSKENLAFTEAEKRVIGIDHAHLGAMILEKWKFSPVLIRAVRSHHDANALRQDALTALTALSNTLVISAGIGTGADGLATRLQGEALRRFGISQAALDLCMADMVTELENARELLHL